MNGEQDTEAAPEPPNPRSLRTPLGRLLLLVQLFTRAWPLLAPLGALYRRTVLRRVCIVAVVGTYGKTTATRAIKTALGERVDSEARRAIGSWLVYELLRARPWRRAAVIEIGIGRPGEMGPMARLLRPDVTVVTSIGLEHIASMKRIEVTRAEKSLMVAATAKNGLVLLNGDDPNVLWMAERATAPVRTFGRSAGCDVRVESSRIEWPDGTRFEIESEGERVSVRPSLIGSHWGPVVAAAVAVGRSQGVPLDLVAERLGGLAASVARLEPVALPSGAWVLRDDEKSGHETIDVALRVLSEIPARRRIVVLGEIPEPQKPAHAFHRAIGERVGKVATDLILLGTRRVTRALALGAQRGGLSEADITRAHHDLAGAIHALPSDLGPGDVILLKGVHHQRLGRIAHVLAGDEVRCFIPRCAVNLSCNLCPMLARGFGDAAGAPGEAPDA